VKVVWLLLGLWLTCFATVANGDSGGSTGGGKGTIIPARLATPAEIQTAIPQFIHPFLRFVFNDLEIRYDQSRNLSDFETSIYRKLFSPRCKKGFRQAQCIADNTLNVFEALAAR